jgi:hypothetical protein
MSATYDENSCHSFTPKYVPLVGEWWLESGTTNTVEIGLHLNIQVENQIPGHTAQIKIDVYGTNYPIYPSWTHHMYGDFDVTIIEPILSGSDLVCYSPNRTYTLSNYPDPSELDYIDWDLSSNLYEVSSTSNSVTVRALNSSTSGSGWVKPKYYMQSHDWIECPKKDIWVGKPGQPITIPSGYPTVEMGLNEIMGISVRSSNGATGGYTWSATGSIDLLSTNPSVVGTVEATSLGNGNFYVTSQNSCGTSPTGGGAVYVTFGGGQLGPLMVYPNPAVDFISIEVDETRMDISDKSVEEQLKDLGKNAYLRILDPYGETKLMQKYGCETYLQINVGMLDPGMYTLQLISNKEVFSTTIVIN